MIPAEEHRFFRRIVEGNRRFVLVTHVNPDGDAIGSQVAVARFLMSLDREVAIVNHDPVPDSLSFLDLDGVPLHVYDAGDHDSWFRSADRLILLDNSAPDRLGTMERIVKEAAHRTLCVDHHPTRGTIWSDNILDIEACAASAMVYELVRTYGWVPDLGTAEALYVGLATDTGFFRFNSTNVRAHRIAAELIELGVQPARCYQEIYERNSPAYARLLGRALVGLRVDADGAIISMQITRKMVAESGLSEVDTSEMTTPLLAIDGVAVALLFRELPGGHVKVSLRSKGEIDVQRLASGFGGGGHRNASGIVTDGVLGEIAERVIGMASELVGEG